MIGVRADSGRYVEARRCLHLCREGRIELVKAQVLRVGPVLGVEQRQVDRLAPGASKGDGVLGEPLSSALGRVAGASDRVPQRQFARSGNPGEDVYDVQLALAVKQREAVEHGVVPVRREQQLGSVGIGAQAALEATLLAPLA